MSWEFPMCMVSPHLYRSPQPRGEDLQEMIRGGLRSVINLRSESYESKLLCQGLGLRYHHIAVDDWTVPSFEQVDEFLKLLEDPENCPALVHCYAGVGRTGTFVSCYRVYRGMAAEQAIGLSDQETPWMGMSQVQRDYIRQFEMRLRGRARR
ncbi:MAG: dual specificity protein phosphatase family protein [Armatimonadetes bacterium]|nr:dual specificity protein phosphatase family protein [Armatimonadota bacterium]